MLYIISTPIGNLKDITYRAVETLNQVDLIAAEDTRHTKILCKHYAIETPLTSYFEHNKLKKAEILIECLKQGKDIALVSDAGTPGISDPGFHLIRLAGKHHIAMTAIPGPAALIVALTLSGLPAHSFVFQGFLPVKVGARRKMIQQFKQQEGTIIFYESPHRIVKTLFDLNDILSDPLVVVARELTKKFEEIRTGKSSELIKHFQKSTPKGEFVVLFNKNSNKNSSVFSP